MTPTPRVDSIASSFIGSNDADEEDETGSCLREFAGSVSIHFEKYLRLPRVNVVHTSGSESRIDYVGLTEKLHGTAKDPRIERDLELVLSCAEDHRAFSAEVELECCVSEAGGRKKKKTKKINVRVSEEILTGMKVSRAVDLYKGKGPAEWVDSYRVLSMQDHLSKVFIGMLKAQVLDSFEKDDPADQYSGVAGGSTDVPTHILQAFDQRATAGGEGILHGCTCGRKGGDRGNAGGNGHARACRREDV